MLTKGAETLPNKVAHDYKALAVSSFIALEILWCEKLSKRAKECRKDIRAA